MSLRIAIISDLHCHHPSSGSPETMLLSNLPRKPVKQHPVSSLDLLIKAIPLTADVLLMPGDMANRADEQGISTAWDYIQKIALSLKTTVSASTLGNHDVNWKTPGKEAFRLARDLLPQFPTENDDQTKNFWSDGYYVDEQPEYRILVINSVRDHTNEISAKRGLIADDQLDSIQKYLSSAKPKKYQIALCHHHPIQHEEIELGPNDLMVNGSRFVELLSQQGFNLLVHGHKHHPRIRIESSGGGYLTVFAAGSFSAGMKLGLGSRTRNVFHLIELETDKDDSKRCNGKIKTWQFRHQMGWVKASQDAADFPHITGFGAVATADTLADSIEVAFKGLGVDVSPWSKIADSVPEIQWVPPAVFTRVNDILSTRNICLTPSAPDLPQYIGTPV